MINNPPAMRETWVWSLVWNDTLEEGMATTSVSLSGESLWTEEPGRLQSVELQRVGHYWATKHNTTYFICPFIMYLKIFRELLIKNPPINRQEAQVQFLGQEDVLERKQQPTVVLSLNAALNMSANLENSTVAAGLENLSFHSNLKKELCQRWFTLPYNCTHFTC